MQELAPIRNGRDSFGRFVFGNNFANEIGSPPLWDSPEMMLESFGEYVTDVEDNEYTEIQYIGSKAVRCEIPKKRSLTLMEFCKFCNTSIWTFYAYEKKDGFAQVCVYIRNYFSATNVSLAMSGFLQPQITARVEGLVDKKEIRNENIQTVFFEVPTQNKLESGTDELKEGEDWELI